MRLGLEDTRATWELASSLPQEIIAEYENGVQDAEVTKDSISYGGHISHTLKAKSKIQSKEPQKKKPKLSKVSARVSKPSRFFCF